MVEGAPRCTFHSREASNCVGALICQATAAHGPCALHRQGLVQASPLWRTAQWLTLPSEILRARERSGSSMDFGTHHTRFKIPALLLLLAQLP